MKDTFHYYILNIRIIKKLLILYQKENLYKIT